MNFNEVIMTPTWQTFPLRLQQINEALSIIIARYHPNEAAMEKLVFGKNMTTAIGIVKARGVALLALVQSGLVIAEYTPAEIKLAVTGNGLPVRSSGIYGTPTTLSVSSPQSGCCC